MSVLSKLRIDTNRPVWLIDVPRDVKDIFEGVKCKRTLPFKPEVEQLIFFAISKKHLHDKFDELLTKVTNNAIFWIAWPKKTGKINSDLARDEAWEMVFQSDWQGVSSVAINEDWTGLRLKKKDPNANYKSAVPMEERKTEGIDYVKRTVKLPVDAVKMMKQHKGLEDFFYSMSFSHKREFIEAIVEAKKPETRQRRIEKMIEQVNKIKTEKEKKKK